MSNPSPHLERTGQSRPLAPSEVQAATNAEYFLEAGTLRLLYYQMHGPAISSKAETSEEHERVIGAVVGAITEEAIKCLVALPVKKQQEIVRTAVLKLLNGDVSHSKNLEDGERAFWESGELRLLRSILNRFDTFIVPRLADPEIAGAAQSCLFRTLSEGHLHAVDRLGGFLAPEFLRGERLQEALKLFVVTQIDTSAQREFKLRELLQLFPFNLHASALQMAAEVKAALGRLRERRSASGTPHETS